MGSSFYFFSEMFLEISESLFLEGQHMETFDTQMSNRINWTVRNEHLRN